MAHDLPLAILLMGPTASGKTDAAVALHERFGFGLVSVDSALIYRGMEIGTAKPGPEVLARAPHRLIDILDPAEPYSAARFRADALAAMDAIRAEGRVPLLVGGTMLYYKALTDGLSALPSSDPEVRAELDLRLAREGSAVLHAELAAVDPAAAARIHPNDPQRIQRALEVWRTTGQPISALQKRAEQPPAPWRFLKLALAPADREALRERIGRRFGQMMAAGFLDEVRGLRARGDLTPDHNSMRAVGYRQLWAHLDGAHPLERAVELGIHATRQFAKRQMTWLRGTADVQWIDAEAADARARVIDAVAAALPAAQSTKHTPAL